MMTTTANGKPDFFPSATITTTSTTTTSAVAAAAATSVANVDNLPFDMPKIATSSSDSYITQDLISPADSEDSNRSISL